jgi:hypothetical protein
MCIVIYQMEMMVFLEDEFGGDYLLPMSDREPGASLTLLKLLKTKDQESVEVC